VTIDPLDTALAAWLADIDSVPTPDLTTLTPKEN
jgi:hypothetical protein